MRDLMTALLMADIVEGVSVSYATFVGYDEVAHHSGIREPDAFAVLRRHDDQLERLERATAQAPRPYHLVVLSDHGQTQGRPFRQRFGQTLEEVVRRGARAGSRVLARRDRRGVGRRRRGARRRAPGAERRRSRARARDAQPLGRGNRRAGTQPRGARRARARAADAEQEAIVLASGGLGLVYLTRSKQRLSCEEIEAAHPRLLEDLSGHPGIGFVMVRSQQHGALVIGARGRRSLADDSVEGEDPLAHFDPTAAVAPAPPRQLPPLPRHPRQLHV